MDVKYKEPQINRGKLIELNEKAALEGADIILNPEMAISGYSFSSRQDIREFVETSEGETIKRLSEISRRHGKYICTGFAEKCLETDIYYNSAFVLDPRGEIICRHRKFNAESKWACPGSIFQENTFDTRWGRVGVLICSDTYYGLIPRVMGIKGVKLLLVPANWPPAGLDPCELWRARAMENGFYIAACNRTGKDLRMSCFDASSCVYGPGGEEILTESNKKSKIFSAAIPLINGRLESNLKKVMSARKPEFYSPIYLDTRLVKDFTEHYGLPEPGSVHIHCVGENRISKDFIEETTALKKLDGTNIFLFPTVSNISEDFIIHLSKVNDVGIYITLVKYRNIISFFVGSGKVCVDGIIDYGHARTALADVSNMLHPELAVAFSKQGCDIILISGDEINKENKLLLEVKSVEQIAIAAAGKNCAFICIPPEGHERWKEEEIENGVCSYTFNTAVTRKKRFQDRVDFELLLRRNVRSC